MVFWFVVLKIIYMGIPLRIDCVFIEINHTLFSLIIIFMKIVSIKIIIKLAFYENCTGKSIGMFLGCYLT